MGQITQVHINTTVAAGATVESAPIDTSGFRRVAIGFKSTQNGTVSFRGGNKILRDSPSGTISYVVGHDETYNAATSPNGDGYSYPTPGAQYWKIVYTNTSGSTAAVTAFIRCEDKY